jgi:hypothetical protein
MITLDGTTGITSPNDTTGNQSYTGTLTGGTGVVNLGSGQFYKDASGNVGIGTSSPNGKLEVVGVSAANNDARGLIYAADTTAFASGVGGGITFRAKYNTAGTYFDAGNIKGIKENATDGNFAGALVFSTHVNGGSPTERMRIDSSGNLLVGTTDATLATSGFAIIPGSATYAGVAHASGAPNGSYYIPFVYANSVIGSITQNGTTGVLYNIVSDQRLKENIVDAPSALSLIDSVKVRSFDFKSDGSHTEFGLIAQEFYEVAPECVSKGDDGKEITQVWGLDSSALVPALIKAIQELKAEVDSLKQQLGK